VTAGRRVAEPAPAAGPIVVDACVAVKWFAREAQSEAVAAILRESRRLVAPDIMPVEAANAWWKKVRRGEMEPLDLEQAVASLGTIGIDLVPAISLLPRASRLAVDLGHPVYDCLYLTLTQEQRAALATTDARLERAADALGIVRWRPGKKRA
jgi:predicted nucleic acid-binding protein